MEAKNKEVREERSTHAVILVHSPSRATLCPLALLKDFSL